jgi:hypothetical protein
VEDIDRHEDEESEYRELDDPEHNKRRTACPARVSAHATPADARRENRVEQALNMMVAMVLSGCKYPRIKHSRLAGRVKAALWPAHVPAVVVPALAHARPRVAPLVRQ